MVGVLVEMERGSVGGMVMEMERDVTVWDLMCDVARMGVEAREVTG